MSRTMTTTFALLLTAAMLQAACALAAPSTAPDTSVPEFPATSAAAIPPTVTQAEVAPPTETPTTEPTPTPTAVPVELPVGPGTPIPYPAAAITAGAEPLVELARLGYGTGYARGNYHLSLSQDEQRLIVSTTAGVGVFAAKDLTLLHFIYTPATSFLSFLGASSVVVARDGSLAVVSNDLGFTAWDLATGEKVGEQPMPESDTYELPILFDISRDDTLLAVAYDSGAIQIHSLPDLSLVERIDRYVGFVASPMDLTFEPSGKRLIYVFHDVDVGLQSVVLLIGSWDESAAHVIDRAKFDYTYSALAPELSSGAGYRYGYFSYGYQPKLTVFDYEKLGPRFEIPLASPVSTIGVSINNRWISMAQADRDGIEVWKEEDTKGPVLTFPGHDNLIWATTVTQDGQTVYSIGWDGRLRKWQAGETAPEHEVEGFWPFVSSLAFAPDTGNLLLASNTGSIFELDPRTGLLVRTLADPREPRRSAWQNARTISEDYRFDLSEQIHAIGDSYQGCPISLSADGSRIAQACRRSAILARLWDAAGGEISQTFEDASISVSRRRATNDQSALSPDGKLLAVTYLSPRDDYAIRLYDTSANRLLRTLPSRKRVDLMAFTPDGSALVTAGFDQPVRVLDLDSGSVLGEVSITSPNGDGVRSLAFSSDGSLLFLQGQDDTFYLISTADWSETGTLVPPEFVNAWALSPSGSLLAIAGGDSGNRIVILDYSTEAVSSPVELPGTGMIQSLAFSPDGRLLAALSGDSVIRLLGVAP